MEPDSKSSPRFWRVACQINHHPGQWQYWFKEQCCAIGWAPPVWQDLKQGGYQLRDQKPSDRGWSLARNLMVQLKAGDWIVAHLPNWRVGRIGQISALAIEDDQWNPIVRPTKSNPFGENGRRILVRWDLTTGPSDWSKVVHLPDGARWTHTLGLGTLELFPLIRSAMRDEQNWVSLAGRFVLERALSDYIAAHPDRLEAGMIAHPSIDVRELTFADKSRADVILEDSLQRLVVAECKQDAPTPADVDQVVHYRCRLLEQLPDYGLARALLVHGGSRRVSSVTANAAKSAGVELVYFEVKVDFY